MVITSSTSSTLEVGDGLSLVISPGDVIGEGTVSVERDTVVAEPLPEGFEKNSSPSTISVDAVLASPVDLVYEPPGEEAGRQPANAVAAVLRHDPELGWYPIAVGADATSKLEVPRSFFSPVQTGWFVPTLGERVADVVRSGLGHRADAPECSTAPPSWAEFDPPIPDVVLTCATTNSAEREERVEVKLVNNRGYFVEVVVPTGVAFAYVDGQPEPIRAVVRRATGRDSVLLEPGQLMTIGLTRPATGSVVPIPVSFTTAAAVATAAAPVVEQLGREVGVLGWLAPVMMLSDCAGVSATDIVPDSNATGDALATAFGCIRKVAEDPELLAATARELLASSLGVSAEVIQADTAFAKRLDAVGGAVRKLAAAVRWIDGGALAIDLIADDHLRKSAGPDGFGPSLSLRALPSDPASVVRAAPLANADDHRRAAWMSDRVLNPSPGYDGSVYFKTPSGNIICAMNGDERVTCGDENRQNQPPPADCGQIDLLATHVSLRRDQVSNGVCTGGLLTPYDAVVLPYGRALSHGGVTCLVETTGVTCINDRSGRGFTFSRERFQEFSP